MTPASTHRIEWLVRAEMKRRLEVNKSRRQHEKLCVNVKKLRRMFRRKLAEASTPQALTI